MKNQKIVKVGITGHLSLQKLDLLELSIRQILDKISNLHPDGKVFFYSPLSPGADLLAAKIAVDLSIPLFVILPFNQDKYLQSFSVNDRALFHQLIQKAEESIELSEEKEDNAYQRLGNFLVENMDILIAVWNGQKARGPGGTGEVVKNFRLSRKPFAWIRADNMALDQPVFLPDSLPIATIQYENW